MRMRLWRRWTRIVPSSAASRLVTLPEGVPELTLGWEALRWAAKYLRHPNGIRAGERWQCTPDQARFWLWWYAVDPDGSWLYYHGVRRLAKGSGKSPFAAATGLVELCAPVRLKDFDSSAPGGCVGKPVNMPLVQIAAVAEAQTENTMRMVRAMARKGSRLVSDYQLDPGRTRYNMLPEGSLQVLTSSSATAEGAEATFIVADEAVSLNTMMPTPDGWKMPDEVVVGDFLYGSNGKPVKVTHLTPVFYDRPCSRLTFDDNTTLTVDDGHLWWAKPVSSAAKPKVWTTAEMVADGRRFCVPKMKAIGGRHIRMGIDPYVLGAWLGDGSSRWASITSADEDVDFMLSEVRRCGVPAAGVVKSGEGRAATISLRGNRSGDLYTKDGSSIRGALVDLGVLNNKHIPMRLKRASYKQRLALLQGLMDTDGHIDSKGAAVFVNANATLAHDVAELARTFGYSVSVTSRVDDRWDSRPTIYKVSFRPDTSSPTFRMPRKAAKVRPPSARRWKSIRSIEPVPSEPVRCFEVDAPDHLFVAGDGWTVTHNTEHWLPAGNGPEFHATLLDNLTKSGNRMLETSNAWKPDIGAVAQDSYETWVDQEDGVTHNDKQILYDARIAPPDTDLANEESLRKALEFVYADCPWANIDAIVTRIWSKNARPDDSKRKYLNRPTAPLDAWCDEPELWDVMAADGENKPLRPLVDGENIVLFFDGSKTRDDTALVGCCMSDGHVFTAGVWSPGNSHDDDSDSVDVEAVDAAVRRTFDRFNVIGFFADVREWESFTKVSWPQEWRDQLVVWAVPGGKQPEPIAWDMRSHDYDFTMACELVEAEILEAKFTHDANPALRKHVMNARRRDGRYGISVRKESPNSASKIDAAVCMIGARMLYRMALDKQPKKRTGEAVFF